MTKNTYILIILTLKLNYKMPRRKHTFTNSSIESIKEEVKELESATHYALASIIQSYYSNSLYSEFLDACNIEGDCFPLEETYVKAFLLELSKAYAFSSLKSIYLSLRRAEAIITLTALKEIPPPIKPFIKILKKSYGERIAGDLNSIKNKRRPLLPSNVFKIIDNTELSLMGIRDNSILLCNMVLGQRCDSLQFIQLKHVSFTNLEGSHVGVYITIVKEKSGFLERPRKRLITPSKDYCPVKALAFWMYVRGVMINADQVNFETFFEKKKFEIKKEFIGYPLWCVIEGIEILQNSFLNATNIGKRVKIRAEETGFEIGTITGHSMRKGCATAWILNLIKTKGSYTSQDWHDLEDHIGWEMDSNDTKKYVDEQLKLLRDTTNLITNEGENTNFIRNPQAIEMISPSPIAKVDLEALKKMPIDFSNVISNKFWTLNGKLEKSKRQSIKYDNQIKKLSQEIVNKLFLKMEGKELEDKREILDEKWHVLSEEQQQKIVTMGMTKKSFLSQKSRKVYLIEFTKIQENRFNCIKNQFQRRRVKERKRIVRENLHKMTPNERISLYSSLPELAAYTLTNRPCSIPQRVRKIRHVSLTQKNLEKKKRLLAKIKAKRTHVTK